MLMMPDVEGSQVDPSHATASRTNSVCMRMHATRKFSSHKQLRRSNWTELNSVVLLGSFHSAEYNKFEAVVNSDSSDVCLP
jgi:hypothetical protein